MFFFCFFFPHCNYQGLIRNYLIGVQTFWKKIQLDQIIVLPLRIRANRVDPGQTLAEAVLMSTHKLCFEQKYEKYQIFTKNFPLIFFSFFVKFSIYLNRLIFRYAGRIFDCQECKFSSCEYLGYKWYLKFICYSIYADSSTSTIRTGPFTMSFPNLNKALTALEGRLSLSLGKENIPEWGLRLFHLTRNFL